VLGWSLSLPERRRLGEARCKSVALSVNETGLCSITLKITLMASEIVNKWSLSWCYVPEHGFPSTSANNRTLVGTCRDLR
jgi:hypothetical protein